MAGVRVRLLGRPAVEAADGSSPAHPRGRKTWALLARIALADRPVGRSELAEALFPDAEDPLAALRWSLADLRRVLGAPRVARGDPLHLDRADGPPARGGAPRRPARVPGVGRRARREAGGATWAGVARAAAAGVDSPGLSGRIRALRG